MSAYLITFDPMSANLPVVHTAITTARGVKAWWHYINGTYIIITDSPLLAVRQDMEKKGLTGGQYLMIEVKGVSAGWLPKVAWDWINSNIK